MKIICSHACRTVQLTILLKIATICFGAAGCVTARLNNAIETYRTQPNQKAFAIARGSSRAAAWGWASGQKYTEQAIYLAMANCRSQLPIYMIEGDCTLYAINNDFVYGTSDPSPPTTLSAADTSSVEPSSPAPPPSAPSRRISTGTCFAVRHDGLLLTANHVVKNAESLTVLLADGTSVIASVEKSSEAVDLALLRIRHETKNYLTLAKPGSAKTGARVFTLGHPAPEILGPEAKYSEGSISSMSGPRGEVTLLQLTVPIQPGNSGGPVVDLKGNVVGIVTAKAAELHFLKETGALPENINWAISAEFARPLYTTPPQQNTRIDATTDLVEKVRQAVCLVEATIVVK